MLKKLITISITAIASLQAATTYDKSLTDGNDNLNYWSDTTNSSLTNHTLVGATEVFTIGSRENIPNVPTSAIKVSTNKLCSDDRKGLVSCSKSDSLEPRYTDDGLATSGESNLRTWYKATTPKSVNGVVDDPCTSLSNTGSVVNWAANFPSLRCERTITTYTPKVNSTIYTNKVNSDIFANKISGSSSYPASKTTTSSSWIGAVTIRCYPNMYSCGSKYKIDVKLDGTSIPTYYESVQDSKFNLGVIPYKFVVNGIGYISDGNEIWPDWIDFGTYAVKKQYTLTCPSGGTLSGSTCTTTSSTCPSGYVDNGTNCRQTIQICPDASWTSATATTCSKVIQICPDASWTDNGTNCRKNVPEYKLFSTF